MIFLSSNELLSLLLPGKADKGKVSETGKGMGDCILVFLSGIRTINSVLKALGQKNLRLMKATVSVVHGSLPPDQQRQVFRKTSLGEWKIVLATNIAETSITIGITEYYFSTHF